MNGVAPRSLWLLTKVEAGRMNIMTTDLAKGGTALPVFSFENEARTFRELAVPRDGWRVRETAVGELVSVLLGPCAGVDRVLLDPLPGVNTRVLADLVGMEREPFVEFLLSRRTQRSLPSERATRSVRLPARAGAWS